MSRGTFRVTDFTAWSKALTVTADGDAVISHAGAAALRLTADRTGLTTALSQVLRREGFTPGHDRGRVLADTAVMMADGGNTVRGIDVLRHQRDLLGEVASPATLSRALGEVDQQALDRIDAARAQVRAQVWELIVARPGCPPGTSVPRSCCASTRTSSTSTPARNRPGGYAAGTGCIRWRSCATTPTSAWPTSCAPAPPGPTTPAITSRCWPGPSPRSPSPGGTTCSSPPTVPAPPTSY